MYKVCGRTYLKFLLHTSWGSERGPRASVTIGAPLRHLGWFHLLLQAGFNELMVLSQLLFFFFQLGGRIHFLYVGRIQSLLVIKGGAMK